MACKKKKPKKKVRIYNDIGKYEGYDMSLNGGLAVITLADTYD